MGMGGGALPTQFSLPSAARAMFRPYMLDTIFFSWERRSIVGGQLDATKYQTTRAGNKGIIIIVCHRNTQGRRISHAPVTPRLENQISSLKESDFFVDVHKTCVYNPKKFKFKLKIHIEKYVSSAVFASLFFETPFMLNLSFISLSLIHMDFILFLN